MPPASTAVPLSLSDRLALQRTRLANERTLLTYVRTSLALVGFGLALLQFHPERGGRLGYTALAVAGVVLAVGLLRFRVHRRQLAACQGSPEAG
jgi:putative membrane protein